jgi:hypothetical protein
MSTNGKKPDWELVQEKSHPLVTDGFSYHG